jgi:hypothetical protein
MRIRICVLCGWPFTGQHVGAWPRENTHGGREMGESERQTYRLLWVAFTVWYFPEPAVKIIFTVGSRQEPSVKMSLVKTIYAVLDLSNI